MTTQEVLKAEFIIPDTVTELFYCPFADHGQKRCSRECKGFYTMREMIQHLRTVHVKSTEEIALLLNPRRVESSRVPKTWINIAKKMRDGHPAYGAADEGD